MRDATAVWARIGLLSFGGPAGQIALMHKELVEERRWISEGRFLHALNYCMLLPGPEAQQLAVYIGWLLHRTAGGLVAGLLFVFPGFITILALSILYASLGNTPWVSAVFYGIKAAILSVVVEAVLRIGKRALKNRVMVSLAIIAFFAIHFLGVPFPLIIVVSGLFGFAAHALSPDLLPAPALKDAKEDDGFIVDRLIRAGELQHITPNTRRSVITLLIWLIIWFAPVAASAVIFGPQNVFTALGLFFSKAAAVTFGGAYSVLAYVAQQAVDTYHWLQPGEMLDGLALAETTPGPLIMVLQFVGYLAAYRAETPLSPVTAGVIGSMLTTWVTFAPCFLWIFAGAPYIEKLHGNRKLHAILSCITAAVVGVILNLSIWLTIHVLFARVDEMHIGPIRLLIPEISTLDVPSLLIAAASMVALLRFHTGLAKTLFVAAVAGIAWKMI